MSESLKSVGAITMFVEDPKRSKEFYERVFGASAVYEDDDAVAFENLTVNLLAARAAGELIEPEPVAGRESGSRFQLTIWVEDADAVCEQLSAVEVQLLNGPAGSGMGDAHRRFRRPRRPRLGGRCEDRLGSG